MATIQEVTSEEIASLGSHETVSFKKSLAKNIFFKKQEFVINDPIDPKRISKVPANRLTTSSVVKAGLVFFATVGAYYLVKTTGILSYFGWGAKTKNSKDVGNSGIMKVKNRENSLTVKTNLETIGQANNPSIDIIQMHKDADRAVKFKEMKVEEFKNLPQVKEKNVRTRRSISVQNPIPDQIAFAEIPFELTIDGANVFSSNSSLFLETTDIPYGGLCLSSNLILKGSYSMPGYAYGVAFSDNYVYIANGAGLQIIDVSDPSNPTLKGSCNTPGSTYNVALSGNYAYVAAWDSGLQIIDISDSSSPTFKGRYNTPGTALEVAVSGNYAYVAAKESGLQIIDVSYPSEPLFKGSYDTLDNAYGVALFGNYAYVVASDSGLQIIDISDPSNSTFKGSYNTPGSAYSRVAISGNYAYVADKSSGLQIVDITDPSNPTFKGSYDTPGDAYGVLTLSGNYACLADFDSGLHIIDISDPSNPTFKGSYNTPGCDWWGVAVSENYAYVTDRWSGLKIIDITNFSKLTLSCMLRGIHNSVTIKACNEAKECATDSFDIIVIYLFFSIVIGSVCISSFCCALIGGGIVAIGLYRNKISKNKSSASNKEEEQKSESTISGDDVKVVVNDEPIVQQKKSKILEHDSVSSEQKITMLPEDKKDVELDEMPNSTEEEIPKVANVLDNEKLSDNLYCPISSKLIEDPVILVESGQTYDRKSIETWLKDHDTDPLSGEKLTNKQLITNFAVKKLIEECQEKENKKIKE
jgi:hypothetical protein